MFSGNHIVRFQKFDSISEMREVLSRNTSGFWELTEPEYHSAYYILNYRRFNTNEWFGVGICTINENFPPNVVSYINNDGLLMVHDNYISLLNLYIGQVRFSYEADSMICFSKYYKDTIIVIAELSATQLNMSGEVLASHVFDDILESFSFEDGYLICQTTNGSTQYKLIS